MSRQASLGCLHLTFKAQPKAKKKKKISLAVRLCPHCKGQLLVQVQENKRYTVLTRSSTTPPCSQTGTHALVVQGPNVIKDRAASIALGCEDAKGQSTARSWGSTVCWEKQGIKQIKRFLLSPRQKWAIAPCTATLQGIFFFFLLARSWALR